MIQWEAFFPSQRIFRDWKREASGRERHPLAPVCTESSPHGLQIRDLSASMEGQQLSSADAQSCGRHEQVQAMHGPRPPRLLQVSRARI